MTLHTTGTAEQSMKYEECFGQGLRLNVSDYKRSGDSRLVISGYITVILLVIAMITFAIVSNFTTLASDLRIMSKKRLSLDYTIMHQPCGNTPAEAHAAGCSFDIISTSFLPARCHDQELADEFLELRPWQWYRDADSKEPMPLHEVLQGNYESIFVENSYHIAHCGFLWRKLHRIIQTDRGKKGIDSYLGSIHHTDHCVDILTNDVIKDRARVATRAVVKFPDCGIP